jgi:hypothetical protein
MGFFKNEFNRKAILSGLALSFLFFLGSTQYTHASAASSVLNCVTSPAQCAAGVVKNGVANAVGAASYDAVSIIAGGIVYILAWLFGVLISIEAWVIGIVLNINNGIMSTSFVQTGFSISLSVANLAFVLGIIVIAIATILRIENYSIKKILWKLIVMAILVNFGLVIIAPIFALSNSFTQYFLNCITPSTGCSGNSNGMASYNSFATTMVAKFNPNAVISTPSTTTSTGDLSATGISGAYSASGYVSIGATLVPLISLVFSLIDFVLIFFVLLVFIVMLMIRYVYIAILAILLPFAWASWVFPSFSSMYSKWWNKFLQWTFFAPIFMFFLYLAFATIGGANNSDAFSTTAYTSYTGSNALWSAIVGFAGQQFAPILQNFMQEIVLSGLILGGLIASDSMGVKFAGTAVKFAQKQGKSIGLAAARRGRQATVDRVRTAGRQYDPKTKETTSWLQRQGSKLQGVPLAGTVGQKMANWSAPKAVQKSSKEDIDRVIENELTNLDNAGLKKQALSKTAFANPVKAAAIAQELAKRDMTNDAEINPLMDRYVEAAEKLGNSEAVFANRPDLMPRRKDTNGNYIETDEEAITRAVGGAKGEIVNVNAEIFNYANPGAAVAKLGLDPARAPDLIRNAVLKLSSSQLGVLGSDTSKGSQERQNNLTDAVKKVIADHHLSQVNTTTGKNELNTGALQGVIAALQRAGSPQNEIDGFKNLEKMVKHMESSSNWGSVLN